jgi:carbonic anhydrase
MRVLKHLFENNRAWAESIRRADPDFFQKLARQQSPSYLWIGCSDSRVPANQIVGLLPGEMFVHRNIANVVHDSDLNCQSVLQFAVHVLKVKHIIVCGHYGCSGVRAAQRGERLGLADHWLRHVAAVRQKHTSRLERLADDTRCGDRLCELNVIEQVMNACRTGVCHQAWKRGQELTVHGWIYGLHDGLLRDLKMTVTGCDEIISAYDAAISALPFSEPS